MAETKHTETKASAGRIALAELIWDIRVGKRKMPAFKGDFISEAVALIDAALVELREAAREKMGDCPCNVCVRRRDRLARARAGDLRVTMIPCPRISHGAAA